MSDQIVEKKEDSQHTFTRANTKLSPVKMASAEEKVRGYGCGLNGRWISAQEAAEKSIGKKEWWKQKGINGRTVPFQQYDTSGPEDKPIWLYDTDGDMYLGEWKMDANDDHPVECGFGVEYIAREDYEGLVYVGNFTNGRRHGAGREAWLDSSPFWTRNEYPESEIQEQVGDNDTEEEAFIGRPFIYEGKFANGMYLDTSAIVTLKDGTCRVGPWKDGVPEGIWWNDDDHPLDTASSLVKPPAKRAKQINSEAEGDKK